MPADWTRNNRSSLLGIRNCGTDRCLWSDSRLRKGVVAGVKVLAFLDRVDPNVRRDGRMCRFSRPTFCIFARTFLWLGSLP
jgi:hypothetical protein